MKKIHWLIGLGILAIPFSGFIPVQGVDIWYVQFIGFIVVILLGIIYKLWFFNKYLSIFNLVCLMSVITADQHPRSLIFLFIVILSSLIIEVISKLNEKQTKFLVNAILVLVFLQGVWVILQYFNIDPIWEMKGNKTLDDTVGFCGSHNQLGVFMAVTAPLVVGYFLWLLPLIIFGLWNAITTTAWIAFSVSATIAFIVKFLRIPNKGYHFRKDLITLALLILGISSVVFFGRFEQNFNNEVVTERN